MKPPSAQELRSLVALLDEEDPKSLDLVRKEILGIGDTILPFIEEVRALAKPEMAARLDAMTRELRFQKLKESFLEFSKSQEPDLENGAFLIAHFGYPGLNTASYSRWLDEVARQIIEDLPADADDMQKFQRLNSHLFHTLGFSGNEKRYYDPENSYLNRVIETRRGIPVSLSVVYLLLAKRLRLPVYGVGTPGHFLAAFRQDTEPCYVDTYNKGRLMSLADVRKMLARGGYEYRPEFTTAASARDIVVRMMRNLISIYQKIGQVERGEMLSNLVEILLTGRSSD